MIRIDRNPDGTPCGIVIDAPYPSLLAIADSLTVALQRRPPRVAKEAELQAILWAHLQAIDRRTVREHILSRVDRIDFVVGHIGIEVKVKGASAYVTRQLWRYAASPQIDGLLLVTTRREHMRVIGEVAEFMGKPVLTLCIADYLL